MRRDGGYKAQAKALVARWAKASGYGQYDTRKEQITELAKALEAAAEQGAHQEREALPIEGVTWLLIKIGSWTASRWDQWLRWEYGDSRAQPMIDKITTWLDGRRSERAP